MRRGQSRAVLWVQLRARETPYWNETPVVVKTTTRRPDAPEPGCVLVRVAVSVPTALLHPLEANAVVRIPEET